MDRKKWDERYLLLAQHVAKWSKDPSSQVGAVVVKDNRIVAVGFNGFPSDVVDMPERLEDREVKYEMVVHAEVNALLIAGQRADGATIYVQGRPVCASCAGAIIQSGVQRVVAEPPPREGDGKWDKSGRIARTMFAEADRHFDPYPHDCLNAGAKPK
jgi:dCMP deaminase